MDDALIEKLSQEFAEHRMGTALAHEVAGVDPRILRVIWVGQAKEVLSVLASRITEELV